MGVAEPELLMILLIIGGPNPAAECFFISFLTIFFPIIDGDKDLADRGERKNTLNERCPMNELAQPQVAAL